MRKFLVTGTVFGLLAVVLGAFAAHGLKTAISAESLDSFETGVRFQMYHAFLLLITGLLVERVNNNFNVVFYMVLFGIILFSGSIYLLATNELTSFDFTVIALVTPVGGGILILSWVFLLLNFIKLKKK